MEKTLAKKRPAWKTRKTAFPTFPQPRLRLYYKSKSTTKTKPSYDPLCGQWGQLTLDKVGNRLSMTDGTGQVTSYGYDPVYELTSAMNASGTTSYTYDAEG